MDELYEENAVPITVEALVKCFPFPSLRGHQLQVLADTASALNDPEVRFIILQAPTGSGKSGIALAQARALGSSFLLTMNKILQEQYNADFGSFVEDLRGRSNYPCKHAKKKKGDSPPSCSPDRGIRDAAGCNAEEYDLKCEYFQAISRAKTSSIALMNFSAGLCFFNYTPLFTKRQVLIIDEAHSLEDQLTSFIEFNVTNDDLLESGLLLRQEYMPDLEKASEYLEWLKMLEMRAVSHLADKKFRGDREKLDYIYGKLKVVVAELSPALDNFVLQKEYEGTGGASVVTAIKINPIVVSKFAHSRLFDNAEKVILMSATIGDVDIFCEALGINKNEMRFIDVPSVFPKENRPVFITSTRQITHKNTPSLTPLLAREVAALMEKHSTEKGIIHVPSYALANQIMEYLPAKQQARIIYPKNAFEQANCLTSHAQNIRPTVILSPSMTEGLDLKDDLSRFQIIVKVPFANVFDPVVDARLKRFPRAYGQKALNRIIQACGRSVRHESDWATTYILDGKMFELIRDYKGAIPRWFAEALSIEKTRDEKTPET